MATVDFTGGSAIGTAPAYGINSKVSIKRIRVDTSLTGITNTNADVYQAIDCPAGTKILDAWFYVVKPESTNTTATFALGITGGTTDGFVSAATCDALGLHATNGSTYTAAGGVTLTAADTIDLLVANAAFTDCIVDVYALVVDLMPNEELKTV